MVDAAYGIYFAAVLLGSLLALILWLKRDWAHLGAALRGEAFAPAPRIEVSEIRVRMRQEPVLQPAIVSICRI